MSPLVACRAGQYSSVHRKGGREEECTAVFASSLIFVDIRYMQYLVTTEIQLFFALLLLSHCVRESGTNPLLQLTTHVELTIRVDWLKNPLTGESVLAFFLAC